MASGMDDSGRSTLVVCSASEHLSDRLSATSGGEVKLSSLEISDHTAAQDDDRHSILSGTAAFAKWVTGA